jgi:hypothetical protein
MQLARHHAFVEIRFDIGVGHLFEGDRPLAAEADHVEEAVVAVEPVSAPFCTRSAKRSSNCCS